MRKTTMKILRVILAGLILSLLLVRLAPLVAQDQSSAGFYLVAVDDCGNPAHEAHLVEGRDGEIPAFLAPAASPEEKTISGGAEVVYRYSGLPPNGRYKLRVVYLGDHAGQAVKLSAGGIEIETRFEEPEHQAVKREIDMLELKFKAAEQGEIAVSLIELWSTGLAEPPGAANLDPCLDSCPAA